MSEKMKKSTGGKLLMRSGGLAVSLPIVLFFGAILVLLNSVLAVIIFGGLIGLSTVVQPYLGLLSLILILGLATLMVLIRSVARYTGGIGKLRGRVQGIQQERERVERLVEKQTAVKDGFGHLDDDDLNQQVRKQ